MANASDDVWLGGVLEPTANDDDCLGSEFPVNMLSSDGALLSESSLSESESENFKTAWNHVIIVLV